MDGPQAKQLAKTDRQMLESWLAGFAAGWEPGKLELWAPRLPTDADWRLIALAEMVRIDLTEQWRSGRMLPVESYFKQFPELRTTPHECLLLVMAEVDARRRAGQPLNASGFLERFPELQHQLRIRLAAQRETEVNPIWTSVQATPEQYPTDPRLAPPASTIALRGQFGRYEILRPLGLGGMGTVYLAVDTQLHRQVALKIPRFETENDTEGIERFYREARAAATLDHPNLCPVYEVGEIGGTHYLTMQYIEGEPLSKFLEAVGHLPPDEAARLIRKLAVALDEAHFRGVVHRDLKPDNIMINKRNEPVIMDFGLARRMSHESSRLTNAGLIVGTPAYMSPEQVSGDAEEVGPPADVYSLGIILYELLTGRVPYIGKPWTVFNQIMNDPPAPPRQLRPELSPAIEAICLKSIAKQVWNRYRTMGEFATALGEYLGERNSVSAQHGVEETFGHSGLGLAPVASAQPLPATAPANAGSMPILIASLAGAGLAPLAAAATGSNSAMPAISAAMPSSLPLESVTPPPRDGLKTRRWLLLGVSAVVALLMPIAGYFWLRAQHGSIQIAVTSAQPGLQVRIDGRPIELAELETPLHLNLGEHFLTVISADGRELLHQSFSVKAGSENALVRVDLGLLTALPTIPPTVLPVCGPVQFTNKPLQEILQTWQRQFGLQLSFDPIQLAQAGAKLPPQVNFELRATVPLSQALQLLLQPHGLAAHMDGNTVRIVAVPDSAPR